jgi:transposase InsO family protein
MDQRIQFLAKALQEEANFSEVCRRFGISRPTGYLWLNRYNEVKDFGLLREHSRKPKSSPNKTERHLEQRVVSLRKKYGWGAKKLQVLLSRQGIHLKVLTINRILKRHGLVSDKGKQRPAIHRFERSKPNELWQMDFKGEFRFARGVCNPLSIMDDHSRYSIGVYGLPNLKGESVFSCLKQAFEANGVPSAFLMDHGTPWWSTTNGHGLTWVSVKLIKQDIRLCYGGINHPQTQGKVERFHRTMKNYVTHKGGAKSWLEWKRLLEEFREEYNHVRPHEALDMAVPASRYEPSKKCYNPRPREWEYPLGSIVKRLNTQGCMNFEGKRLFVCEALAGEWVRVEEVEDKQLVSYRKMYIREVDKILGKTRALVFPRTKSNRIERHLDTWLDV